MISTSASQEMNESSEAKLTPRQEELLELLAIGLSNREIATQLGITQGTVKQHLFILYRRLGVANRTKALVAAEQLNKKSSTGATRNLRGEKQRLSSPTRYGWRMISVVAIYLSDNATDDPAVVIARDRYLSAMRHAIEYATGAVDGRFASMPYGGLLAWFGHPKAHSDDSDRAVSIALLAHKVSAKVLSDLGSSSVSSAVPVQIGVAVASQAEIVAHDSLELFGAETFRRAARLARYASGLGIPLADDVTRRLAPLSVPWLKVRFREKQTDEQAKPLGALFALGTGTEPLPEVRANWGGLKFLDDVMATVRSGVAQWLSVECWPPTVGIALTDALGSGAATNGFQVIRLRLPSNRGRLAQTRSLYEQLDCFANEHFDVNQRLNTGTRTGSQDQLIGALSTLCANRPTAILVYGAKGLERFVDILGVAGVEALVSKPILLVCAGLSSAETSQTSLRRLGPRPGASSLSRLYALKVPVIDQLSDRVRIGLQELLDSLSVQARLLVHSTATESRRSFVAIARQMKLSDQELKECLNELTACGLVVPSETSGQFRFRDNSTTHAIANLSFLSGASN